MSETQAPLFSHHRTSAGYVPNCARCNGTGKFGFNHLSGEDHCYLCLGVGTTSERVYTRDEAVAREARQDRARERREAQAQAEWEAGRVEREARAQASANAEAERLAELASWSYLSAGIDERVTVHGTVAVLADVEGYYGSSRLVVVETDAKQSVAMFTTASWAYSVERGQLVTITGTVKSFGEYEGRAQTTLSKPKLSN